MDNDREVMRAAVELAESGEEFVLVTVTRAKGSTPRNAGARMIVRRSAAGAVDGVSRGQHSEGAVGTIGGGQLEHLVLDAARACLEKRSSRVEEFVLGADADQCCGGVMELFFEYFGARARLVVFGAGHVSYELAALLEDSAVDLTVVDDRPDWNSEERFGVRGFGGAGSPRAGRSVRRVLAWREGVVLAREQPETTMAVVMTCSHDTDFDLLRQLLSRDGPGRTPGFVGLIGSRSKRACLFGRLVASGIDDTRVQSVKCPVGVGDTGKTPRAVAISIAAQVLIEARRLADAAATAGK